MSSKLIAAAAAFGLLALAAPASAETAAKTEIKPPAGMQRFAGTVKTISADTIVVSGAAGDTSLKITPDTKVMVVKKTTSDQIKAGSYLGTTNVTTPEGGRSTEVHMMPSGPGVHYTMDEKTSTMMTNGTVGKVAKTAKGDEFDVAYGGGTRHVIVPPDAMVTTGTYTPIETLKPGYAVTAIARPAADGGLMAAYISTGVDGTAPPR